MNAVFYALVLLAFLAAAAAQLTFEGAADAAPMALMTTAIIEAAKSAVTLALGLVGVMALFLGLMKVAEAGGLMVIVARAVRPLMVRLFPDVPAEHPAMGAMVMNLSANVLGLGNAATPLGIRAMQELDRLNPHPGTASNAMVLFLALNTSSVTLLPTGVIALRIAAGSSDPAAIVPTTLFATFCSTAVAILAAKLLAPRWPAAAQPTPEATERAAPEPAAPEQPVPRADAAAVPAVPDEPERPYPLWVSLAVLAGFVALIPLTVLFGSVVSPWIIPVLVLGFLTFGVLRGVPVYETLVEGAKDGFTVALRIIPYLVAILVAVGMFRASGALDLLLAPLALLFEPLGLARDAIPMALLRPLSGSGAYGYLAETINNPAIGPDSYTGLLVSTLQGSTETTFYVLALYFGAVGVRRVRHALAAGLIADAAGVAGAVIACSLLVRL